MKKKNEKKQKNTKNFGLYSKCLCLNHSGRSVKTVKYVEFLKSIKTINETNYSNTIRLQGLIRPDETV